jgi:hypothetical protein
VWQKEHAGGFDRLDDLEPFEFRVADCERLVGPCTNGERRLRVRPWLRRLQGLRRLERLWRLQGLRRLERLRMGRLRN